MSATTIASKVTAEHLARTAYLYVRQSTLAPGQGQHRVRAAPIRAAAARDRARLAGRADRRDRHRPGQSGASAADREGFQRLVADVGLGKAGIVLGLEVSRLARNNADWHRLLEISALAGTLICDEDGLYDPADFNDRLLLGLKGTMSEAELHFIRARLQGGILSKARRGELPMPLPVGLVYDSAGKVVLDPDRAVQDALRHLFATFRPDRFGARGRLCVQPRRAAVPQPDPQRRTQRRARVERAEPLASAQNAAQPAVCRRVRLWPAQARKAPRTGTATLARAPPRAMDRTDPRRAPGLLTWEQFEHNQRRSPRTPKRTGPTVPPGPAREGPALLQGIAICGRCGKRMSIRYHQRRDTLMPDYQCVDENIQRQQPALPRRSRSHHRPRDQPTAARHRHPTRARGRAHRPSRTRSPRQRGRPAPPLTRRTSPPARRPRPPPVPRSRP